jgi:hypothetical protein
VIKAYDATRPTKEIGKLVWELELIYDNGIPDGAEEGLNELFSRPELVMQKKSKKAKSGSTTVDLIPLIGRHSMKRRDNVLCLTIDLAGQNPGLNPNLLQDAIGQEYPALKPDFLRVCRLDILDGEGNRFEGDLRD